MKMQMRDISAETFGKYQFCTKYGEYWYADSDFNHYGKPKNGAIPDPGQHPNAKPYHDGILS